VKSAYVKIFQNSVTKVFTASPIDVILFKLCEMLPTGNQHYLQDQKKSVALLTVATAQNAPKIVSTHSASDLFTKSVHFQHTTAQSYTRTREYRFFGPVK